MSAKALNFPGTSWNADVVGQTADSRLILELYDSEQVSLRRYLIWLGLDSETAEETVQESFLKLHQHLLAKGDRAHLRAWLYRVAHNVARNTQLAFRTSKTSALDTVADPPSRVASAEEELLEHEKAARLRASMDRLTGPQRNCLVLRSQGLKYREIAEALGLSVSTVAENVQRGLERLKENV
jgi:RNA polymerase sigma-70 factor (ECF subfamily)